MLQPQFILNLAEKLVVDLFAGGGGASTGIEQAIGRHVDIAVNHDPAAVALHQANHPQTRHFISDVFEVNPLEVTEGQPVGLLWASPDCKHFSKAKGGKPVSKKIRGLAWVVVKWAKLVRPDVICLENVEEFQDWGPLTADGLPCPINKGKTFRRWKAQLQNLGYKVEHRELRACDYGAPTIRKRLFLVARCDGQPIVWPQPTHAKAPAKGSGLKPWRTAAECIDWSIPCPSIFERERPLAEATQRRIAHGIKRYVLDNPRPFIVGAGGPAYAGKPRPVTEPTGTVPTENHRALVTPVVARIGQTGGNGKYANSPAEPMTTITSKAEHLLVSPTLVQTGYGERPGQAPRVPGLDKPLGTAVDGQKHALVAAFLAKHYGGVVGSALPEAIGTITSVDHHSLVTAHLIDAAHADVSPTGVKRWGKGHRDIEAPAQTVTGSGGTSALVSSTLVKLRGTSNSADPQQPLHTISAQGEHHAIAAAHLLTNTSGHAGGAADAPLHTITTGNHHAAVYAVLMRYFGTDQDPRTEDPLATITTKHRDAVVTVEVDGEQYAIADIGMRMLQPRELYRAQGFHDSYIIDRGADGRRLTKAEQVRMCGNSVCPPLARAIVGANYSDLGAMRRAA